MPRPHITGRQIQLFILGASLVSFVGALISVGLPRQVSPLEPVRTAPVRLMVSWADATHDVRYLLADLLDPSLLALPSAHGFSRKPWERAPAVAYESSEFNLPPAILDRAQPVARPRLIEQTPLPAQVQAAAERAALTRELANTVGETLPAALDRSVFRISGDLAARALIQSPQPGPVASAVPVRPALVRIGVGGDGLIRYTVLERSSGDTTVDARAVELCRGFRFEPRAQATLTPTLEWGLVKFLWAFASPATTNPAPAAARAE